MTQNKIIYTVFMFFIVAMSTNAQKQQVTNTKGSIVTLSSANYKSEIAKGLVIVDFWADWCGPCRKLDPILREVVAETSIKLGKLNVDNYKNITTQMGVTTLPTMIIYKDGKELKRLVGLYSKDELLTIVKSYQ